MLRGLITILFLILFFLTYSQDEVPQNTPVYDMDPIHFGFTLGFSTMDFIIRHADDFYDQDTVFSINNKRQPGFNIAMVTNFKLGQYFDLRFLPGLTFGQRDLMYGRNIELVRQANIEGESLDSLHIMKIESTFLQFPLQIKYKARRVNNYRPYVIAGVNYCFDLEAQKKIKKDEHPKVRLGRHDIYYELGFGIDYYFPFFKLSSEIKLSIGLRDMLIKDSRIYSTSIDRLNSKMVSILFHFE